MTDTWQKLGDVNARIIDRLAPVGFHLVLQGPLAAAVKKEANKAGRSPETIIAEAVRSYFGDAA
jgi:hypothetical protein